jgi:FKBP-type peptidyl-prolyl cis-trans isomerase (trigger factor)
MEKTYANLKRKSEKHGSVEFGAEVDLATLAKFEEESLAAWGANLALPGFRKGKVPLDMVRERVDAFELFEDAAEAALRRAVREIAEDESLKIIGRPELSVEKLAPGNPVAFAVRYALLPEVELPDYKKIAAKVVAEKKDEEVTEKELTEAIDHLRKMMSQAPKEKLDEAAAKEDSSQEKTEPVLAELTLDFVKKFGPYETVEAFRDDIKKELAFEKTARNTEAKRDEMLSTIVKDAKVKVPDMLIEQELTDLVERRADELEKMNMTLEQYLEKLKKKADELEKEERTAIERQIRTSLVIREIQVKEDLKAEPREVRAAVTQLKVRYPNRNEGQLAETAEALVLQGKLFEMLEGAGQKNI